MNEKHYKEKLSGFVNHELTQDERQAIAEHLLQCGECRAEHDEIKLGAALASEIKQAGAPENLWHRIENSLDGRREKASLFPTFAFFSLRGLAAGLLIVCGLAAIYFVFLRSGSPEIAKKETQNANAELPRVISTPNELAANQNANQTAQTNVANQTLTNANSKVPNQPQTADSNIKLSPAQPKNVLPAQANLPAWNVETLAGTPKAGNQIIAENGKLTVGEFLETDANSKAKIQVANIGNVEIAPNSRVKLVNTKATEHRLALEKGALKAKILAPPRLFIVDTPSAVAVDLGCEYTLEVDAAGNGRLHVTAGFVALERGGREVIVPAGAIALTRKGKGVGTPFSEDASTAFQNALYKFDFENGGSAALNVIIRESGLYDSLTLWHLLSRTPKAERTKVFDALEAQIKPPANVTREGILRLDKKMLDAWWKEIETVWFE
jgi:hypothetical protein